MRKFRVQGSTGRLLQVTLLAIVLFTSRSLLAMTFTVDTQSDAVDAAPGDGVCATAGGNCSLRAAVQEANAWPGADVIRVPKGTYTLTIPGRNEDKAATGDLDISGEVTINGASGDPNSADATIIDGGGIDRVFDIVVPGTKVTITNLIVQGGKIGSQTSVPIGGGIKNVGDLTISDLLLTNNTNTSSGGGGIANEEGSVVMDYTAVEGNSASSYGGVQETFGDMIISHSKITGNNGGSGGGVGIIGGNMSISDSDISNNIGATTQGGNGGGISNNGDLTLVRSLVSGNTGAQGGGIANGGTGGMTVINSTIDGNKSQSGGGIFNQSTTGTASAVIISSTISHNNASGALNDHQGLGGGIFYTKGLTTIQNSIIADNSAPSGADCSDGTAANGNGTIFYPGGQLVSEGYNLDHSGTCLVPNASAHQGNIVLRGAGDKPNTNPGFASSGPEYNGGPTQTLALTSGSPAVNAVPLGNCTDQNGKALTEDQRGLARPVGGACEIGAVEYQASAGTPADLSVHTTASPSPVNPGDTIKYAVNIRDTGPNDATGVNLTDELPSGAQFDAGASDGGCSLSSTINNVETINCTVGSVTKDSGTKDNSVTVVIAATVPTTATGTITNTAKVTNTNETDPDSGNNTDSTDVQVNLTADLQATIAADHNPAILNQDNVTYTVVVKNLNGAKVPDVALILNLPSNASPVPNSTTPPYSSTSGTGCTEHTGSKTVTCQLGSMGPGDTVTIKTTVKPTVKGDIVATATANFPGTDSDPSNNQVSITTSVKVQADVGITITDNPDPVQVRNDLQYILNVTNYGPSPSSDVKLTATLPAGVTFDSVSSSKGASNCQQTGVTVTCDLKGMIDNYNANVTIFVTPTAVGPLHLTASVAIPADETDNKPANNTASESTTVIENTNPSLARTDLVMALASDPNPVTAGSTLTYTMKVTNNGPDDAGSVIAVLNLPASVKVTSPSSGCSKDASTNIVRCLMGNINAGKSAQATVGVTPSQVGTLTVTAVVNYVGTDTDQSNNTFTTATTVAAGNNSGTSSSGKGGGGGALGAATLLSLLLLCAGGPRRRRRG